LPLAEAPEYAVQFQLREFPEETLVVQSDVFVAAPAVALEHDHCTDPKMYLLHLLVPPGLPLLLLEIDWSTKADLESVEVVQFFRRMKMLPSLPVWPVGRPSEPYVVPWF